MSCPEIEGEDVEDDIFEEVGEEFEDTTLDEEEDGQSEEG